MKPKTQQPWRVAVCIDTRDGAGRRRLYGVAQHAQRSSWRMMLIRKSGQDAAAELNELRPQGIITYRAEAWLVDLARRWNVPLIDTAVSEVDAPMYVSLDNHESGRLAAESLAGLGLKSFGYLGVRNSRVSDERRDCFARQLASRGFRLAAFAQRQPEGESHMGPLMSWLKGLPKPVGILTFDDKLAERLLSACRWAELPVPTVIAVLGIGNDDLICQLTWPTLSSIDVPSERIGFEAAEMLERAMRGGTVSNPHRKLLPMGITLRGSTASLAVQDPLIRSAAQYIREHAGQSIGVRQVARVLDVSTRTLDRRFTLALGRTVHQELIDVRMQQACKLLAETLQSVDDIAAACGYGAASSFSRAFHKHMNCWPTEYRNRMHPRGVSS